MLTLHPEAIHRLEALVRARLGGLDRPVPVAMLVHDIPAPGAGAGVMAWFRGGEPLGVSGSRTVTFHDRRGLIVDPIAVASMFADLLTFRPGLLATGSSDPVNAPGGVATIAGQAGPALRVHIITPHGATYVARRDAAELSVLDATAAGAVVAPVPDSGLVDLTAGQRIGRAGSAAPVPPPSVVLWGPATGGTLGARVWSAPALPVGPSLPRQFFRLMAADLDWHLLGNRAYAPGDPVVPDETDMPADAPLPVVRQTVAGFDYLIDGNDVLGAMGSLAATALTLTGPLTFLVSPIIDSTLRLPPAAGGAGHWPAFPTANAAQPPDQVSADAMVRRFDATGATAPTAAWRATSPGPLRDVIVSFPAGALPPGTHVRVFPRTFQLIRGIGQDPSFVRGDGGSALIDGSGGASVLLVNPFALDAVEAVPDPATITVDIVAVSRTNTRKLLSAVHLVVGSAQSFTDNPAQFEGLTFVVTGEGFTSIAPCREFGIPNTTSVGATPALTDSFVTWMKWLTNEGTWPRIGPHLPGQARFETVMSVTGMTGGGTPTRTWRAVLSGARYTHESRCASPQLGDPGNPPGPDAHLTGVAVGGQLARDLAFHALRRSQSIVPFSPALGWLVNTSGDEWNVPPPDASPAAGQPHMAAAMLETISPTTDSPELSLLPVPSETDSLAVLGQSISSALGLAPSTLSGAVGNETRLRHELQREIATARRGQRDAMWSIARAVAEAREYVLIESPMFARTARPTTGIRKDDTIDLVAMLVERLDQNPRLKVMICLPRLPDFDVGKENWVRAAFRDRKEALEMLTSAGGAGGMRVAAFHPIGFPGRPTVGRSTVVLVDDVYALVGTSHWRRRGMTFDGGCDVVSMDRHLDARGVSGAVARFRQELLATRLGIAIPSSPATSTALWTRLAEPESAYDVLRDLLSAGGLGRCQPAFAGPTDTAVIPEDVDKTDPDGMTGPSLIALLGGLVP